MQQVKVVDVHHGVEVTDWQCVCSPAQVGGAGSGDLAPFAFVRQISDTSSGNPIVFSSQKTGAELWWHYPYEPAPNNNQYVEVKHQDGTIARYEKGSGPNGPFFRDTETNWIGDWWRLKWTKDPFDNKTEYYYSSTGAAAGKIERIEYPNGLIENWSWQPAWIAQPVWTGYSGLEVTYNTSSDPTVLPELSWFMAFENLGGQTHFAGKARYYFAQASKFLPDPQPGALYDTSATALAHLTTEFRYGTGGNADDIVAIGKFRHPQGAPPAPEADETAIRWVLQTTYVASGIHLGKVESQTLAQYGLTTTFEYDPPSFPPTYPFTLPAGVVLHTFKVKSEDDGTYKVIEFDPATDRVYRTRSFPGPNGRPRTSEGSFNDAAAILEPDEMRFDRIYDATCVCQKPIRTELKSVRNSVESAPRVERYHYDVQTKLLRKKWRPNSSTAPGAPAEVVDEYDYHIEPGIWSPQWIKEHRSPDGVTRYSYPAPIARANSVHGKMQGRLVRTYIGVRRQLNENTEASGDVADSVTFNVPGNPALAPLQYSGPATGSPRGQVRLVLNGDGVESRFLYSSLHGGLTSVVSRDSSTTFSSDVWGRLNQIVCNAGHPSLAVTWSITEGAQRERYAEAATGVPSVDRRFHYDFWGNPAVALERNLASDNNPPHKHGAAPGSARSWVRNELIWQAGRLLEVRSDRRPLDEGDATAFGGTNPLMGVTTFDHQGFKLITTAPNGSVTEETYDGFGKLFRVNKRQGAQVGTPSVDVARLYYDDWLDVVTKVAGQPGVAASSRWEKLTRNGAGAVTSYTEPTAAAVPGYAGSLGGAVHRMSIDSMGRVTMAEVLDGSTVVARRTTKFDQLDRVMKSELELIGAATPTFLWNVSTYGAARLSHLESTQRSNAPTWNYYYDVHGRLERVVDSTGNECKYGYIPGTNFVARVDKILTGAPAKTYTTVFERDAFGRSTAIVDGFGAQDSLGASISQRHVYGYCSLGYVDRYIDPSQPNGRVATALHDALGRSVEKVWIGDGADHVRTSTIFIDSGLAESKTRLDQFDGLGHVTRTVFDFAARPYLVQYPGADLNSEPTTSAPNKHHCQFTTYNEISLATDVYDGDNGRTRLAHDGSGRVILRELVTAQQAISTFNTKEVLQRDLLGRIVGVQMWGASNGGAPNGTPLVNNFPVAVQAAAYDSLGRLKQEDAQFLLTTNILSLKTGYSGSSLSRNLLQYDDGLTGSTSQRLDLTFVNDAFGRLGQIDWDRSPATPAPAQLATYTWRGGNRLSRTVKYAGGSSPTTGTTSFVFDDLGRMTQLLDSVTAGSGPPVETNRFTYGFDASNNLKKEEYTKVGGRAGDRFTYDAYHRLKEAFMGVDAALMAQVPDPIGFSASQVARKEEFIFDAAQNRDSLVARQGQNVQTLDYQIETGTGGLGPSNRYTVANGAAVAYDQRGNLAYDGRYYYRYDFRRRLQEVWQVMPTDTSEAPAADEKFLVVEEVDALDQSRKEVYDEVLNLLHRVPQEHKDPVFRGRLRRTISGGVLRLLGGGSSGGGMLQLMVPANLELRALYGYDAYNRRVLRVVVGQETWLSTFDGWREIVEHRLNFALNKAEPVKQFVHGARMDELLAYRRRVDVGGTPTWENYFVQHGGQDSATRLLDANGVVVERYEYDAYGTPFIYGSSMSQIDWSISMGLPFLWKGVRFDPETTLYYMRNRYYSSAHGRFLSRDPLGVWFDPVNSGNEYGYVGNSPLIRGDLLGLQADSTASWWNPLSWPGVVVGEVGALAAGSGIPLVQNLGKTMESAGTLLKCPATALEGALTLSGDKLEGAAGELLHGGVGLIGLGSLLEGRGSGTVSASSIDAPERFREQMEKSYAGCDSDAAASRGVHNVHAASYFGMTQVSGLTELPWVWLGGLYHELDPASVSAEWNAQGAWLFVDAPLDLVANTLGMAGGLLLPASAQFGYSEGVGALLPLPPDRDPTGRGAARPNSPSLLGF